MLANSHLETVVHVKLLLPTELVTSFSLQILHDVHKGRRSHRDIKPQNIMVSWKNGKVTVHLIDWAGSRLDSEGRHVHAHTPTPTRRGPPPPPTHTPHITCLHTCLHTPTHHLPTHPPAHPPAHTHPHITTHTHHACCTSESSVTAAYTRSNVSQACLHN